MNIEYHHKILSECHARYKKELASRDAEIAKAFEAGRQAEREECAGICDMFGEREMHPAECAGAIRARSTK